MSNDTHPQTSAPSAPPGAPRPAATSTFPLKRFFYRRIVPGLVLFIIVLGGVSSYSARHVMQEIYLEQAQHKVQMLVAAITDHASEAWQKLLSADRVENFAASPWGKTLTESIGHQTKRIGIVRVKLYDLTGQTIYATDQALIGTLETSPSLRKALLDKKPVLSVDEEPDGSTLYEYYIPLTDESGQLRAVFEIYEEPERLNALILRAMLTAATPATILFLGLIAALAWMVGRAQTSLDSYTGTVNQLQARLKSLVSKSAAEAMHEAVPGEGPPTRRKVETLFYSDVRDFTGYAESKSPEHVISFLNDIMEIQISAIEAAGGDVDKLIGDAILARFEGADADRHAIETAIAVHDRIARSDLPCRIGIGIYTGGVIEGAIGSARRRDYTIIGDSVNIAARLCAMAKAGSIVADTATVRRANVAGFGDEMSVEVKGRADALLVRCYPAEP